MTDPQSVRTCKVCGGKKEAAFCPTCGKDTPSLIAVELHETVKAIAGLSGKVRAGEVGKIAPHLEFSEKHAASGDSRLPDGVEISMVVDRRKDEYHQTVKDARTGEVLHDEHEPLSQHQSRTNKP